MNSSILWIGGAAAAAFWFFMRQNQPQFNYAALPTPDQVRQVQTILREQGYYTGPIDGDFGRGTGLAADHFVNDRPALVRQFTAMSAADRLTRGRWLAVQAILARMPRG